MSGLARFAAALVDPSPACPPGMRCWNGSDPLVRFAVHRNNMVASLVAALAESFPVTRALVGEAFFAGMATTFVRRALPATPVLAHYGQDLAEFIASYPPAHPLPYLADVARLEAMLIQAYHAADADALPAERVALLLSQPDVLPGLRFTVHPSLGVLMSPHAVVSIWSAHQGDGTTLSGIDPGRCEQALVMRVGLEVEVTPIGAATACFVEQLAQAATLAQAASRARACGAFQLEDALAALLRRGALVDVTLPPGGTP